MTRLLPLHRALLVVLFISTGIIVTQPLQVMAGPSAEEYGVVLNLSGKQRMLSQKMSKEVLLMALDIDKEKNLENLAVTASLFEKTLAGLKKGSAELKLPPTTDDRINRQLDKIRNNHWTEFYNTIQAVTASGNVTAEQIDFIAGANLPLLKEMNRCVKLYEKDAARSGLKSDPGLAVTINLAGKQRMLTQKMSKEYLLIAYGSDVETNKLNLMETVTLFERTLNGLLDGDPILDLPGTQAPDIRTQLNVVKSLWSSFKPIVKEAYAPGAGQITKEQMSRLARENMPLLVEMNKAVKMFEVAAGK